MVRENDKNTEKMSCSTVVYDSNNSYIKIKILFYLFIMIKFCTIWRGKNFQCNPHLIFQLQVTDMNSKLNNQ